MSKTDQRVDDYIAKSREFAQPILERVRKAAHRASSKIGETMKWSTPHFVAEGLVMGMAAFKNHVTITFWRGGEMEDPEGFFVDIGQGKMCAIKVTRLAECPTQATLVAYLKDALRLDAAFSKQPKDAGAQAKPPRAQLSVPKDLTEALSENAKANAVFNGFSPSKRKDYVEWIEGAKRDATRQRRLKQAIEWIADGKSRNWKYES